MKKTNEYIAITDQGILRWLSSVARIQLFHEYSSSLPQHLQGNHPTEPLTELTQNFWESVFQTILNAKRVIFMSSVQKAYKNGSKLICK